MSSTGAAAAIPKTVEVKSVSHGMIAYPCSLKGISILICTRHFRFWQTARRATNLLNHLYSYNVNVLIETYCYFIFIIIINFQLLRKKV